MKTKLLRAIFSQESSPRLWLLAQNLMGGTPDKQAIIRRNYHGERRVVEIGCSCGNIARALIGEPGIQYLGLDIDEGALAFARDWFKPHSGFEFKNCTLHEIAANGKCFDLVFVAGMLHHVADDVAQDILSGARAVLAPGARVLIFDPIPLRSGDGFVYRLIHSLEQGKHLRSPEELRSMIRNAGLIVKHEEEVTLGSGLVPWLKIMSFSVMTACATE